MNGGERSLEQVYSSAVSGLYARLKSNYDFIYRRFGDEGMQLIADMSRDYGLSIAGRAKDKLKDKSMNSVADYLLRIFDTVIRGSDSPPIIQRSDTAVVIKVAFCPICFEKPEMCLAHTAMEKTVVEELNPALTYRIGKSIPAGDSFCEHIIEIRKT
ncbi:hypothetical protein ACFLW1_02415 [Chloroflexota bacterium]